jgi:hypothetical protein
MPAELPAVAQAREDEAWGAFVDALRAQLASLWPEMAARLGDRHAAFVDVAVGQALERGFGDAAAVARYANLCVVWGPGFADKPGFEWVTPLLPAPGRDEWLAVHQLVRGSLAVLDARSGATVGSRQLEHADTRLMDAFAARGRRGAMRRPAPAPRPRRPCDLEAAELRLLDTGVPHAEYRLDERGWQRADVPLPPPVRGGLGRSLPDHLALLSPPRGDGPAAVLQARLRMHAVCDESRHPALRFTGTHGCWPWIGLDALQASWPAATLEQPAPPSGPGTLVAEETSPDRHRIEVEGCGLRHEGPALGPVTVQVGVWPATQWFVEIQRAAPAPRAWLPPPGRDVARAPTRCRVERDGRPQDGAALRAQFEQGLDAAGDAALAALASSWQAVPGLTQPTLEASLGLLFGRAALTWGWRAGDGGLVDEPLMRLVGEFELAACQAELVFGGELSVDGARARIELRAGGRQPLHARVARESAAVPLSDALRPLVAEWRFPFEADVVPLAAPDGALVDRAGPATGALIGRAGLRPCTSGRSGWEWFALLRLEAVALPVATVDPWLGARARVVELMPSRPLAEWSIR